MDKRLKAVVIVMILMTLACTSVSDFVGMADPDDPGLDSKELEDDSIGASAPLPESASSQGTYVLTPEEMSNAGQHNYTYQVSLGDKVNSGISQGRHEFSETGVTYWIDGNDPLNLVRVGENEYALENGAISLRYKMSGYEAEMASGHFYEFTITE